MSKVQQLLDAARYDEVDKLKMLLQEGINVDSQDEYGTSALHNACANGNIECVKALIQSGCSILKNDSGNTALHRAVLLQQTEIIQLLFESFPALDVLQKNDFGKSAVDIAFQTGNETLLDLVLSHDSAKILEESVGYHGEEVE